MMQNNVNPKWAFAMKTVTSQLTTALVHDELVRLMTPLADAGASNLCRLHCCKGCQNWCSIPRRTAVPKLPCRLQCLLVNGPIFQMMWPQVSGCKLPPLVLVVVKILKHSAQCCINIGSDVPLRKLVIIALSGGFEPYHEQFQVVAYSGGGFDA